MALEVKKEEREKEKESIAPSKYFEYIKGAKHEITTKELKDSYGVFVQLAEKYNTLGQKESLKRLSFLTSTLIKEEKIIEMGINTFIYKDDIADYIDNVVNKAVKIIELSRYMREIPDDLVEVIEKTKNHFDCFYVLFTDYTGKEERRVERERREKDPILFGSFKEGSNVADRFYFLGDWVDEYCDLTLDKMVQEYKNKKKDSPTHEIKIPSTSEELLQIVKSYQIDKNSDNKTGFIVETASGEINIPGFEHKNNVKNGFFDKIRSIFKKS